MCKIASLEELPLEAVSRGVICQIFHLIFHMATETVCKVPLILLSRSKNLSQIAGPSRAPHGNMQN
jgi:hypothetical protein